MNQDTSLDDLFREAKATMRAQAATKAKSPKVATPPDESGIYRNPDNWTRGSIIVLIHQETESLLGYFVEWKHKSVQDARRLVRESLTSAPEHARVEYVSGDWSPKAVPEVTARLPWHTTLPACLDILLLDFALEAREVILDCIFGEGTLDRVELVVQTVFANEGQFLSLPEATNILPRLSPKTVAAIHRQLEKS